MNPKNKKCMWEYCNEECKCNECERCSNYRPRYANTKKQLIDYKRQGKSLKYLINYMLSMEQYNELYVLSVLNSCELGCSESDVIEALEYDFAIDMSEYKNNK